MGGGCTTALLREQSVIRKSEFEPARRDPGKPYLPTIIVWGGLPMTVRFIA